MKVSVYLTKIYARQIADGLKTIEDIPEVYKDAVADYIKKGSEE